MNEKEWKNSREASKILASLSTLIGFTLFLISSILSPFESYIKMAIFGIIFLLFSACIRKSINRGS